MVRKHCEKMRKHCSPAFSPFPIMFSKGFFFRVIKSQNCVVKGHLQSFSLGLGTVITFLTHDQTTNFRLFQTERVCRSQFQFDENGSKLSKWVENTVGKGEIACYKQFLLFPQCFQKACFPGASKGVIVWEWVNNPTGTLATRNCETIYST